MSTADLFPQAAGDVPDELWKARTPVKRQADAAELWLKLTGREEQPTLDKLSSSPEDVLARDFEKIAKSLAVGIEGGKPFVETGEKAKARTQEAKSRVEARVAKTFRNVAESLGG